MQGFNRQLVSTLRPGAPLEHVKRVWGSRWQEPKRDSRGLIGVELNVGCTVRIDVRGFVGSVSFFGNFPAKYSVEGLQLGMGITTVLAAQPTLQQHRAPDGTDSYGIDEYQCSLPDNCELRVRLKNDRVCGITIERLGCDYPAADEWVPAPPGKYPVPTGAPGAPFADPNLKLAVLESLRSNGAIDLGSAEDLAMHVFGRYVDLNREGYELLTGVYDFLVRYPLAPAHLARVTELYLDPTCSIYSLIWPLWDGETDQFDVKSLAGIEHCPNISALSIAMMWQPLDLSPLEALSKLTTVELVETATHTHADVLLRIPALRSVCCTGGTIDHKPLDALRANGVSVHLR